MSPALVQNQDFSTVVFEAGVTVIASITLKMQESFAAAFCLALQFLELATSVLSEDHLWKVVLRSTTVESGVLYVPVNSLMLMLGLYVVSWGSLGRTQTLPMLYFTAE
jgi:hypothetical protein